MANQIISAAELRHEAFLIFANGRFTVKEMLKNLHNR
jgi:hypothetical protein